jgi:hypothetical protein
LLIEKHLRPRLYSGTVRRSDYWNDAELLLIDYHSTHSKKNSKTVPRTGGIEQVRWSAFISDPMTCDDIRQPMHPDQGFPSKL